MPVEGGSGKVLPRVVGARLAAGYVRRVTAVAGFELAVAWLLLGRGGPDAVVEAAADVVADHPGLASDGPLLGLAATEVGAARTTEVLDLAGPATAELGLPTPTMSRAGIVAARDLCQSILSGATSPVRGAAEIGELVELVPELDADLGAFALLADAWDESTYARHEDIGAEIRRAAAALLADGARP